MAIDMKEALTRKLGPLPAWGWGVALGGGILAWRFVAGGGSSSKKAADPNEPPVFYDPGGAYASEGFLSNLSVQLSRIEQALNNQQPPAVTTTPTGVPTAIPIPPPPASVPPATGLPPTGSAARTALIAAYNAAQAAFTAGTGDNPGTFTTWASRQIASTQPTVYGMNPQGPGQPFVFMPQNPASPGIPS